MSRRAGGRCRWNGCAASSGQGALLLVQTPALAALLHLAPLHADEWLGIAAGAGVLGVVSSRARRL